MPISSMRKCCVEHVCSQVHTIGFILGVGDLGVRETLDTNESRLGYSRHYWFHVA